MMYNSNAFFEFSYEISKTVNSMLNSSFHRKGNAHVIPVLPKIIYLDTIQKHMFFVIDTLQL